MVWKKKRLNGDIKNTLTWEHLTCGYRQCGLRSKTEGEIRYSNKRIIPSGASSAVAVSYNFLYTKLCPLDVCRTQQVHRSCKREKEYYIYIIFMLRDNIGFVSSRMFITMTVSNHLFLHSKLCSLNVSRLSLPIHRHRILYFYCLYYMII